MDKAPQIEFLGIRHHGPGCARHLDEFLKEFRPDRILIEGPQNAQQLLEDLDISTITLPASILLYKLGVQHHTYILPFAVFSPEWVAISYAKKNGIPVSFIDLPLGVTHFQAQEAGEHIDADSKDFPLKNTEEAFAYLSKLQGIDDVELWWEINFETVNNSIDFFHKLTELIHTIKPAIDRGSTHHTKVREAWMRLKIRKHISSEGSKTAVVCGAAHLPYLINYPSYSVAKDKELIKLKSKVPLSISWIPWSYKRLSSLNNYSAGVQFPLFYEHIFNYGSTASITITAALSIHLREKGFDISLAHTLEAVNLARTLAALRGLDIPGIDIIMEACKAVYNIETKVSMDELIRTAFVGLAQGEVPIDLETQALIADFRKEVNEYKLGNYIKDNAEYEVVLDLRNDKSLSASQLIWRMKLLGVDWGTLSEPFKSTKGTFNEYWVLQWNTEFLIYLFHQCLYGTTIRSAAIEKVKELLLTDKGPVILLQYLKPIINAQIDEITTVYLERLENTLFKTSDINDWMELIPELITHCKYGSVRHLDLIAVRDIISKLTVKVQVNLESVLSTLPQEEIGNFNELMIKLDRELNLMGDSEIYGNWIDTLTMLSNHHIIPAQVRGWLTGLSLEKKKIDQEEVFIRMACELSNLDDVANGASWVQGIMSTQIFTVFEVPRIMSILNDWLMVIDFEKFRKVLPGLRKSFAKLTLPMQQSFKAFTKTALQPLSQFENETKLDDGLRIIFNNYVDELTHNYQDI